MFEKLKATLETFFNGVEKTLGVFGLELVTEWRKFYATYSFWFFVIIGGLPDFYDMVVSSGMIEVLKGDSAVPALVTNTIKVIAFLGAATRFIKQKAVEAEIQKRSATQ